MPRPTREPDSFDPTINPYPRYDCIRQPCRAVLTEIVLLQGDNPPKSPASKALLDGARQRLRRVMRDVAADETHCLKSLKRIEQCARVLFGGETGEPDFIHPDVAALWERLLSLTQGNAVNGVLTDLEERG